MNQAFPATTPMDEPATGHESPEVDVARTILSTAAVAATVVITCIVSRWVFFGLVKPLGERSATPLYGDGLVLPPAPRLEGIEMMSDLPLNNEQVAAVRQLQTYGWADRDKRLVRIPIERAMQLAIERDWLPSVVGPPKSASTPMAPDASTSGPKPNTP
jgi:hypothetical protein